MSVFNSRGLHFIHLNINSLLPKIDELRNIAKLSNAAVIGIGESKLDWYEMILLVNLKNLEGSEIPRFTQ